MKKKKVDNVKKEDLHYVENCIERMALKHKIFANSQKLKALITNFYITFQA